MKNEKKSNESLFIERYFFFSLPCFYFVTFPRNLVQIFRRNRSRYVRDIFFHSFYTFEVMTQFIAEVSLISIWLFFLNITPGI